MFKQNVNLFIPHQVSFSDPLRRRIRYLGVRFEIERDKFVTQRYMDYIRSSKYRIERGLPSNYCNYVTNNIFSNRQKLNFT